MFNPDYIVGLVDGEGSFTCYVKNPGLVRPRQRRVVVEPKFCVKLIAKDKIVLRKLKRFFNCGNIYRQKDRRVNHGTCYRYEVSNRSDLLVKIIPFFKQHKLYFRTKQKDFKLFCQTMDLVGRKSHLTRPGLEKIYRVKQKMH